MVYGCVGVGEYDSEAVGEAMSRYVREISLGVRRSWLPWYLRIPFLWRRIFRRRFMH